MYQFMLGTNHLLFPSSLCLSRFVGGMRVLSPSQPLSLCEGLLQMRTSATRRAFVCRCNGQMSMAVCCCRLSLCLSLCLSAVSLSVCVSVCFYLSLSLSLTSLYMSLHMTLFESPCLPHYLTPSICLALRLSLNRFPIQA